MIGLPSIYLLLNGSIVLLTGLLSGIPMWLAITQKKEHDIIRAWRVSHSTLIMDGLMMLIIGLVIPYLTLSELAIWVLVWALIFAGYGFVIALIIGAWKGFRGLTFKPYGLNTILFGGHVIGVAGSFIGIVITIYGCITAF